MHKSIYNGKRDSLYDNPVYRPDTPHYPSVDVMSGSPESTAKVDKQTYSGTEVKGIATMHKSNAIPVTSGINTNPKLHAGGVD